MLTNNTGFGSGFSYSDQWLAELVTWPVQSGAVLTGLPLRKSVLLALVLLSSKWIKQFIQNFIYRCLGGVSINFNRTFEVYDSWKIKFGHGSCRKVEVSSHEDSASEFCCVGSIFSMKLLGFVSKAIKLLLTFGRSVQEYIAFPSVGQYGKGCGQYIHALTSHSVNKSIVIWAIVKVCTVFQTKLKREQNNQSGKFDKFCGGRHCFCYCFWALV